MKQFEIDRIIVSTEYVRKLPFKLQREKKNLFPVGGKNKINKGRDE